MNDHQSPIDANTLIEKFIKRGHVRVAGREEWLTSKTWREERKKIWQGYSWSEFDDRILEIYNDDLKEKPNDRKVFAAAPEPGTEFAQTVMKNPLSPEVTAARELLASGVPAGFAERIKPWMSEDEKIFAVLRDSHNHAAARGQTNSHLIIYPNTQRSWLFMKSFSGSGISEPEPENIDDREKFLESGIKILAEMETFPTVDILDKFVEKGYRQDMIKWLDKACRTQSPLRGQDPKDCMIKTLGEMIYHEGLLDKREGWEALIPETLREKVETAIEAVSTVMFIYLGQIDPVAFAGLAIDAVFAGRSVLEVAGKIPLSGARYGGIEGPFIAENGAKATNSRIYAMLQKLGLPDPRVKREE